MTDEKELSSLIAHYVGLEGYAYLVVLLLIAAASFFVVRLWLIRLLAAAIERTKGK